MKSLKLVGILLIVSLLSIGFYSCSDDDDTPPGNVPELLIRTWYMGGNSSITFNSNGTGSIQTDDAGYSAGILKTKALTRATLTFTYTYNDTTKQIILSMSGEKAIWTILRLTEAVLEIEDEEGDVLVLNATITPDPTPIAPSLLYGDWGYAGKIYMSLTEDGYCTLYDGDSAKGETVKYKFENNRIIFYDNGEWWEGSAYVVKSLTQDYIKFDMLSEGVKTGTFAFFRVAKEENTIGPASYLYNKTWTTFDEDSFLQLKFNENGTGTYTESDGNVSFKFSYNESTHKLTLTLGSEKEVWEIIKLTQKAVFFKIIDEDGYSEEITEFRVLD